MAKKAISLGNLPEVAARLRASRKACGITQEQAAEKLGLKQPYINRYESGAVEPPLAVMLKLSEIYSVSVDWLLAGEESASRPRASPDEITLPHVGQTKLTELEQDYLGKTLEVIRAKDAGGETSKGFRTSIDAFHRGLEKPKGSRGARRKSRTSRTRRRDRAQSLADR